MSCFVVIVKCSGSQVGVYQALTVKKISAMIITNIVTWTGTDQIICKVAIGQIDLPSYFGFLLKMTHVLKKKKKLL